MKAILSAACFAVFPSLSWAEPIWVEGEAAAVKAVTTHGWYNSVKRDALSGGDWLSHFDAGKPGSASYDLAAPDGGEYIFWVRANHVKSELAYRLNGGEWQEIDLGAGQRGAMNIAADNKPDLRFISWAKVGKVSLKAGANRLEFRMTSGPQNHGGIDCFCLSDVPWVPSGILKPGKQAPAGPADWFPVVFDADPFSPDSLIDVSRLVEAPAGKHGFLKRDGDALRFEKAPLPSKFWAVGVGAMPRGKDEDAMRQAAKWYRKHGINLVRQHTMQSAVGLLGPDGKFDAAALDAYDK